MNGYQSMGVDGKKQRCNGSSSGMLAVAAIVASLMAGCAPNAPSGVRSASSDGSGGGSPPVFDSADPYHYRCTGACIEDF
jgi:hypothetical protein